MSLETELREALAARAASVESRESDPYARVHTAVTSSRRRRRAVAAASLVAVAALAVGLPALTTQLRDGPGVTAPATREPLPAADNTLWRSIGSWPVRGALADDNALVRAIEERFDGRTIFVEDVAQTRVALMTAGGQLTLVTGRRGSAADALSTTSSVSLSELGSDHVITLSGQGALVVLTTPGLTSAEVSGTPAIALDGAVSRSWRPISLTGRVGRSTSVPLSLVRVGGLIGSPGLTFGDEDRSSTAPPCGDPCGADDLAALEDREVDEEVAHALVLDPAEVDTRTTWRGEVPSEIASRVTGDAPAGARSSVQVVLSTLPGGQVLRTVVVRTESANQSSSWDVERLNPVAAATAEVRPVVLATAGRPSGSGLTAWVLAPTGSTVRAVSPRPTVWPTSNTAPVRDGVARLEVGVDNAVLEQEYAMEVRGADGSFVGTWPAAPSTAQLAAP